MILTVDDNDSQLISESELKKTLDFSLNYTIFLTPNLRKCRLPFATSNIFTIKSLKEDFPDSEFKRLVPFFAHVSKTDEDCFPIEEYYAKYEENKIIAANNKKKFEENTDLDDEEFSPVAKFMEKIADRSNELKLKMNRTFSRSKSANVRDSDSKSTQSSATTKLKPGQTGPIQGLRDILRTHI